MSWGDGSADTKFTMTTEGAIPAESHSYNSAGTFTVAITVTDKDGGQGKATTQVSVVPSLIVLDPTASGALTVSGNAIVNVPGAVEVDSNSSRALSASGNAHLTAAEFLVHGKTQISGNATLHGPVTTGVSEPNPLAGLTYSPVIPASAPAVTVSGNSNQTLNPGTYSSITVSGNGSLTLNPGIYVIAGGGFNVSGNAKVTGQGVSIYNTASAHGAYGAITVAGNAIITLTPSTAGPLAGILFFQDPANKDTISISGNGQFGLSGIIYAPTAQVVASGNAIVDVTIIADELQLSGNAMDDLAAENSQASQATPAAQQTTAPSAGNTSSPTSSSAPQAGNVQTLPPVDQDTNSVACQAVLVSNPPGNPAAGNAPQAPQSTPALASSFSQEPYLIPNDVTTLADLLAGTQPTVPGQGLVCVGRVVQYAGGTELVAAPLTPSTAMVESLARLGQETSRRHLRRDLMALCCWPWRRRTTPCWITPCSTWWLWVCSARRQVSRDEARPTRFIVSPELSATQQNDKSSTRCSFPGYNPLGRSEAMAGHRKRSNTLTLSADCAWRRAGRGTGAALRSGDPPGSPCVAAPCRPTAAVRVRLDGHLPVRPGQLLRPRRRRRLRPGRAPATGGVARRHGPQQTLRTGQTSPAPRRDVVAALPASRMNAPMPAETPSQIVANRELLQKFREQLSEEERRLADLRAAGLDWAAVAAQMGGTPEGRGKQLARAGRARGQCPGARHHANLPQLTAPS